MPQRITKTSNSCCHWSHILELFLDPECSWCLGILWFLSGVFSQSWLASVDVSQHAGYKGRLLLLLHF